MGSLFSRSNAEPQPEQESFAPPREARQARTLVGRAALALPPSAAAATPASESAAPAPAAAALGARQEGLAGVIREASSSLTAPRSLAAPLVVAGRWGELLPWQTQQPWEAPSSASSSRGEERSVPKAGSATAAGQPQSPTQLALQSRSADKETLLAPVADLRSSTTVPAAGSKRSSDESAERAPASTKTAGVSVAVSTSAAEPPTAPAVCGWSSSADVYAHKKAILSLPHVDGLGVRTDVNDIVRTLRLYVALEAEEQSLKADVEAGIRSAFSTSFGSPQGFELQFEHHLSWADGDLYAGPFLPCWVAPEAANGRVQGVVSCLLRFGNGLLQVLINFHVGVDLDLALTGGLALEPGWPPQTQRPLWNYKCSKYSHLDSNFNQRPPTPRLRMAGVSSLPEPELRWPIEHGCFTWIEDGNRRILVDTAIGALEPAVDNEAAELLYDGSIDDLKQRIRECCSSGGAVFTSPLYLLRARSRQLLPQKLQDYDFTAKGDLGDGLLAFLPADAQVPVTEPGDCGSLLVLLHNGRALPLGYLVSGMRGSGYGLAVPIIPCLHFAAQRLGASSAATLRLYHSAAAALQHPLRAAAIDPRSRLSLGYDLHLLCEMPGKMHLLHDEPYHVSLPAGASKTDAWLRWTQLLHFGLLLAQKLLENKMDAAILEAYINREEAGCPALVSQREAVAALRLPAWHEADGWREREFTIWLLEQDSSRLHFKRLRRVVIGNERPCWICAECAALYA